MELSHRTFNSGQIYSESEIRAIASDADFQAQYLIANAPDAEYWFVAKDGGWVVDHTWASMTLIRQPSEPSVEEE